ncbi:hypothetical protein [uncultured Aquimarina sp.]|uniref:hypothetical protein n=1 Tax=uncultured Aquimarina sp. TaxID=575652 RepID=UPI00260CABC5|nr:hypothetical protein [uncultured Aquimarina sp.]
MASKNSIKILTPATEAVVNDSEHLITLDPGVSVSLEFTDTEGYTDEEIKNIQWIANMFYNSPKNSGFHKGLKGATASFRVPTVYSGGGLGWVEPVIPGHDPQFKAPFGYFINSIGKRSIDKVEWRDIHGNEISGSKFFTEAVQLHIYTTGLYGHEIKVWLKDIKSFEYELDLDEDVNNPDNTLAQYFSREVKVLQDTEDSTSKVQKVVIDIRLEKRWDYAGNTINIIPIIEFNIDGKHKTAFDKNALVVKKPTEEEKKKVNNATKSGNKPTTIGKIVTDVAEFKPCFFTKIEATYFKGDEETTGVIYDTTQGLKPEVMSFAAVAGPRHGRKEVKIVLDTDTKNCLLIGSENLYHKDKVIDVSSIEEAVVIESSKKDKGYRATNADKIKVKGLEFEQEDGSHGDNNDNGEFNEDHVFGSLGLKSIIGGASRKSGKAWNRPKKTYSDKALSDTEVIIEVPYQYGKTTDNETLGEVIQYIWPASKKNIQQYPIKIHTCRQPEAIINVDVYPDIKWTLQFCYNSDLDAFKDVRQKYEDYQVRIEKVDKEAKETYDDKIARNEDMADKYEGLIDEINGDKKKNEKRIKKQEKKIAKLKGKDKAKAKKKLNEIKKREKSFNKQQEKYQKKKDKYLQNVEDRKKDKNKYVKKEVKKANNDPELNKKKPKFKDMYDFDDAIEDGLSDIILSLWADWDRPAERFEVTAGYQKYVELLKTILRFKKIVDDIFGGKKKGNIKGKTKGKKKRPDISDAEIAEKRAAILKAFKPKSLASVNIVPPSVALAGSWYAENPKSQQQNEIGTNLELTAILDPIIGAEIVLNFMALVQKSHPVVYFALGMMEMGGFEIRLDLTVTGAVFAKGFLQYNTASGKSNITPGDIKDLKDKEDDAPMEVGGRIEMEVYAGIKYQKKYEAWSYEAAVELSAYASVVTGITISGFVEWVQNDKDYPDGVYLNPKLTFHGLTVTVAAKGSGKFGSKDSDEAIGEIDAEAGGEFVVMDPYEAALDFKIPLVN